MSDTTITLNLTEYEASIVQGALGSFAEGYEADHDTAQALLGLVERQLPEDWRVA